MEELKITDRRSRPEETAIQVSDSPNAVIMMAMQKNYDPAFIEKMMALQERYEANVARKAFFQALADFKSEAPAVTKDMVNPRFNSKYTSLGKLLETYNPILGKHGLSLSHPSPTQTDTTMTVEARLTHRMGHSESVSITAPIDKAAIGKESGKASRNPLQDIKSTFTYLRSATTEAILGVTGTLASSIDDDGNGSGNGNYISDQQQADIRSLMQEVQADESKFLTYLKVDSVDHIPAARFKMAVSALEAKRQKVKERQPGEDG